MPLNNPALFTAAGWQRCMSYCTTALLFVIRLNSPALLFYGLLVPAVQAVDAPKALASALSSAPLATHHASPPGLQFEGSPTLNSGAVTRVNVHRIIYTEPRTDDAPPTFPLSCHEFKRSKPSSKSAKVSIQISIIQAPKERDSNDVYSVENRGGAYFISSATPPAPGLRVIVRNVSPGLRGTPLPYTDREYDRGEGSEGFQVRFGRQHSGRHLVVVPGNNDFTYEIKRGAAIVESGVFTAIIRSETQQETRQETQTAANYSSDYSANYSPDYPHEFSRQCEHEQRLK